MRFKRSGSRSAFDANIDGELKDIVNAPENGNRCGECGSAVPTWCSTNLGVFLCGRCASVHRKILGTDPDEESGIFSNVKSLSMERWEAEDIVSVASSGGNKGNMRKWNPKNEPFPFDGDEDKSAVERFIREKYILGKYRNDQIMPSDYGSRSNGRRKSTASFDNDDYDDYGMPRHRSRSRSRSVSGRSRTSSFYRSGSSAHISEHDFAYSKYGRELRQLRELGFTNEQKNIDAITYSHGDVNGALDYLNRREQDRPLSRATSRSNVHSPVNNMSGSNSQMASNPPLPSRPQQTGPKPAVFDGTGVVNPTSQQEPQPAIFDGSVQQYYDPATNMIYVDQQQYMAAVQGQGQQFQQQSQPQMGMPIQQTIGVQPTMTGIGSQVPMQFNATGSVNMIPTQVQTMTGSVPMMQPAGMQTTGFAQQSVQPQIDKNAIMNLYSKPDQYTTPVEITPNTPQYQQVLQQQQLQQQQLQQQQLQQQQLQQQQLQQQQLQQQPTYPNQYNPGFYM